MQTRFFYKHSHQRYIDNKFKSLEQTLFASPTFKTIEQSKLTEHYNQYAQHLEQTLQAPTKITEQQLLILEATLKEMSNFSRHQQNACQYQNALATFEFIKEHIDRPKQDLLDNLDKCFTLQSPEARILIKLNPPIELENKNEAELDRLIDLMKMIENRTCNETRLLANLHFTAYNRTTTNRPITQLKHLVSTHNNLSKIKQTSLKLNDLSQLAKTQKAILISIKQIEETAANELETAKKMGQQQNKQAVITHIKDYINLTASASKQLIRLKESKQAVQTALINFLFAQANHLITCLALLHTHEINPLDSNNLTSLLPDTVGETFKQLHAICGKNLEAYYTYAALNYSLGCLLHKSPEKSSWYLAIAADYLKDLKDTKHDNTSCKQLLTHVYYGRHTAAIHLALYIPHHYNKAISYLNKAHRYHNAIPTTERNPALEKNIHAKLNIFTVAEPGEYKPLSTSYSDASLSEDSDESSKKRMRVNDDVESDRSYKIRKL